jgi:hypothetical protein
MNGRFGTTVVIGLALVSLLFWGGVTFAASEKQSKDIVIQEASGIRSDNPDFRIKLKPTKKSRRYAIGDEVAFTFTSSRNGYVTIVDVGSSGKVHVVFPNRWHRSNKVVKNRVYRIPEEDADYAFRVRGPKGINYVKAIGTLKPYRCFPKEALLEGEGPFAEVKDPAKAIKDIAVELGKQDKKGWTEAETKFEIVSRRAEASEEDEMEPEAARESDDERPAVKLWTERKSYRIGEPVTLYFYAERDGYLNLIDFGTSDKVRVIFPNRFQRDNFVKGGEVVSLPMAKEDEFKFRVRGPEGVEVVKAVFTSHKLQLYRGSYDFDKYAYQPWEEKSDKINKDIDVQLDELPARVYARTKTSFRVRP